MALKLVILVACVSIARCGNLHVAPLPGAFYSAPLPAPIVTSYRLDRPLTQYAQSAPISPNVQLTPIAQHAQPIHTVRYTQALPLPHLQTSQVAAHLSGPIASIASTAPQNVQLTPIAQHVQPIHTVQALPVAQHLQELRISNPLSGPIAPPATRLTSIAPAHLTAPVAKLQPVARLAPLPAQISQEYDPNPQYTFAYSVDDSLTGDSKGHTESRNGDLVQGSYSVNDPDGTRRTVDYTADSVNGFNAIVRRDPLIAKAAVVAPAIAKVHPAVPLSYTGAIAH